MKRFLKQAATGVVAVAAILVVYAYARTLNKTELEFLIHINQELVLQSVFGESPTFAIWLEDPGTGETHTVFATRRVATGDWEGKPDVPVALPVWSEINRAELLRRSQKAEAVTDDLVFTGATPLPGYFRSRVRIAPGTQWICRIEMNLAGDFNESYPRYDPETRIEDEYSTGQPSILYSAVIEAMKDSSATPVVQGMCLVNEEKRAVVEPLQGITTATGVFDEISIRVVRPKPRIIEKRILKL
ncbi:MAG: hypothetical protein V2B15_03815 [Bacteroidota bacterium]